MKPGGTCQTSAVAPALDLRLPQSFTDTLRRLRAQPDRGLRHELTVRDTQGLDPSLPARDVADERSELDQLRFGEVLVELFPHLIIITRRVPADGVGVTERYALAFGEERRLLEVVETVQLFFVRKLRGILLPSGPDGALITSIIASERL